MSVVESVCVCLWVRLDGKTEAIDSHHPPSTFSSFLQTHLPSLRATYPHLDVAITPRPGHHPYLRGDYVNGTHRVQCVRGTDAASIAKAADALVTCVGRKASVRLPPRRHVPAVRGPGGEAVGVQGGWVRRG